MCLWRWICFSVLYQQEIEDLKSEIEQLRQQRRRFRQGGQ